MGLQSVMRETNRVHKNSWSLFQCATAGRKGHNKKAPRDGVQECGRPPAYKVRFMPLLTSGVGWGGVRWDGYVRWEHGE